MRNKITAAIMLAAVLLLGGCSLTGNVLSPAPTDALPVVTVTLPGNDAAVRPEPPPIQMRTILRWTAWRSRGMCCPF